ncbi:hypothetical protein [Bradyrhizobium sp. CCBAU 51627]|uniref:hypothetical protein n=1 Tax=Bradyrhizobium sp. CCBAU 51627 TaxID=1325088 RepID=UPI0023061E81|nr:hypothetical protein [Bradyrhizobium sp. CCBAU 51627]MDA9435398.1 hypothetical protein [Bradyrhizobium sp. CCBAU 51627]
MAIQGFRIARIERLRETLKARNFGSESSLNTPEGLTKLEPPDAGLEQGPSWQIEDSAASSEKSGAGFASQYGMNQD